MKKKQYFKNSIYSIAMALVGVGFASCMEEIELGDKIDEGAYEGVTRIDGQLLDVNSNKNQNIIELRAETHDVDVYFSLTQLPNKGVDAKIEVDVDYVETFNAGRAKPFELLPVDLISIEHDGTLLLAPDELRSMPVSVTIKRGANLEAGKTYILPLRVSSTTEGINISKESGCAVYMVKPILGEGANDTFKGEGAVKTILYFEANDTNPLNALTYVLEDGSLFFDEVILFAANINYNPEKGVIYVHNNPNIQFLLDNSEQYIQPLRRRGMKVLLGILGNHDESGVAQLSEKGAQMFAKELADYVDAYNLDGVNYDDEYSDYPDLNNPLFTNQSEAAAARLCYETKRVMPDKVVSIFSYGAMNTRMPSVGSVEPVNFVDYSVANYGSASSAMGGGSLANCSGMSVELYLNIGNASESFARSQKARGYGYYMFFAMYAGGDDNLTYSARMSDYKSCRSVCKGLYDQDLVTPTHYYKKADLTPYPMDGR